MKQYEASPLIKVNETNLDLADNRRETGAATTKTAAVKRQEEPGRGKLTTSSKWSVERDRVGSGYNEDINLFGISRC